MIETAKQNSIWRPQQGSQETFLSCPVFEALFDGTRGNGKSDCLLMDYARDVGKGYGQAWRGILFRQSYPQLADLIVKSQRWFTQIFPGSNYNLSDHVWTFPDGETLLLRYMENMTDFWQYLGHEYSWVAFEELTNWPTDECYESMKSCCRSSDPDVPRRYRATANPYGVGHSWVKSYFVDPAPAGKIMRDENGLERVRIHGDIRENKILMKADPSYVNRLKSIKDPNKRKAWLKGSWDIVGGGAVSDLWNPGKHILEPFKIPRAWRLDRAFDWGSSKPFSVGWYVESNGEEIQLSNGEIRSFYPGSVIRFHEWYGWNGRPNEGNQMVTSEIAKGIVEIEKQFDNWTWPGPADPSIWTKTDQESIASKMAEHGVKWKRGDNSPGSRAAGLQTVREYLAASLKEPMEGPGLFIFSNCRHFIRTIAVLPRDEKRLDDVDSDSEDH